MKANELRIGNYVNVPIPEQCPFRIDDFECLSYEFIKVAQKQIINGKEVHPFTWYGDDLQPISLTEEWLLKFGFEKVGFQFIKDGIELFPIRDLYYRGNFPIKSDIKYVNQLQNLYFALTGEELKLKEDESKT